MAWGLGSNLWRLQKLIVTWKFRSWCHEQSEAVWMGENEPEHRICSEHMFIELRLRWSKRWKILSNSQWLSVSLTMERGSVKVTMKTVCVDLWTEDSLVYTMCCAEEIARTGRQNSIWIWRWLYDSSAQQNWPWNEDAFRKIGELVRKKTALSSRHGRQHHLQIFFSSKKVKSTETNIENNTQQQGNEYGRAVRS